jgi:hypothetical protein
MSTLTLNDACPRLGLSRRPRAASSARCRLGMARARSDAPTPRRPSRPTVPRPLQPADAGRRRGSGSCAPCRTRRRKRRERVRTGPHSAGKPCARARHGAGWLVLGGSTRADHGPPARVGRSRCPPPPTPLPPTQAPPDLQGLPRRCEQRGDEDRPC